MYLLKQNRKNSWKICGCLFTFHHVSIKTTVSLYIDISILLFTFHHVSIKTLMETKMGTSYDNSHSTMYLLKPMDKSISCTIVFSFTFHHVSIKTHMDRNMTCIYILFTVHHVSIKTLPNLSSGYSVNNSHSTMYLLKLDERIVRSIVGHKFTFHHVSIKTYNTAGLSANAYNSHSTMYLLKR